MRPRLITLLLPGFLAFGLLVVALSRQRDSAALGPLEPLLGKLGVRVRWYDPWIERCSAYLRVLHARGRPTSTPDEWLARYNAATALKAMGTNAWPAIPALLQGLDHQNLSIRVAVADTLAGIAADKHPLWKSLAAGLANKSRAGEAFLHLLRGKDASQRSYGAEHRRFALVALSAVGSGAQFASPDIADLVNSNEHYELRALAVTTMANIADPTNAIPTLRSIVGNTNEWPAVSAAAAQALGRFAPPHSETCAVLKGALEDSRSLVRVRAAEALWLLNDRSDRVLPVLTNAATHKLASIRLASVEALGRMCPQEPAARQTLLRLASDGDEGVRNAASTALQHAESGITPF